VFDAILYINRTGIPWKYLPHDFPGHGTVYFYHAAWRDEGIFAQLNYDLTGLARVKEGRKPEPTASVIDTQSIKTSTNVPLTSQGTDAAKKIVGRKRGILADTIGRRRVRRRRKLRLKAALLGRSRGGQTSKVHTASERTCRPLAIVLTEGQAADSPQFIPVLAKVRVRGPVGRPRTRPDAVAGDKAYSSRRNRAHLRQRQIKAVIPEKRDQAANRKKKGSRGGRPVTHDAELYKERNTVERLINRLKAWRGIATRFDKTPESYLAGLHLRASMIWIKKLTTS
ncbi:IS5 family transposase, partial [Streptomyces sp. NPDC127084]|uniref:IS5 family transposase n=1 Tax=Streptomyces sp. NPDC127084 TaxID=3347133 RepID=UPI003650E7C9